MLSLQAWDRPIRSLTQDEIKEAVQCDIWQAYRKSMKGKSTPEKLEMLHEWIASGGNTCIHCNGDIRHTQVDNYVNALKRGGQLDTNGNVVR